MKFSRNFGIISNHIWDEFKSKQAKVKKELQRLSDVRLHPNEHSKEILQGAGTSPLREATSLADLLRRPQICYEHIRQLHPLQTHLI